jgi:hypothetical protein
MDGTDMQRRIASARRQARLRAEWDHLRREQRPRDAGTAEDCLKAARDPDRRPEPMHPLAVLRSPGWRH